MGFGAPGGEMGHAVWVGLVVGFAGFLVAGWEEVGVDVDFGRHGSGLFFFLVFLMLDRCCERRFVRYGIDQLSALFFVGWYWKKRAPSKLLRSSNIPGTVDGQRKRGE